MILSIFPGVDLLGRAFEEKGFSVVRGPDLIYGGDIRSFRVDPDLFEGVIGGPPCPDFSLLKREAPSGYGLEMIEEFKRVVDQARPDWWLMENVPGVPDVTIRGYNWQRFNIDQCWYEDYSRLRHIQFGSVDGRLLDVTRRQKKATVGGAALASDRRSFRELARIQGVPDIDLPAFTVEAKKRAIGNGVPMAMGRVLAQAVLDSVTTLRRICRCGCGRTVTGRQRYESAACRKRVQRKRDRSIANCDSPRELICDGPREKV